MTRAPQPPRRGTRLRKLWSLVLIGTAVAPAVFILAMVLNRGVDVPFADEWTIAPVIERAQEGTLTFQDLYAQHNEHRYLVPKLVFLAAAKFAYGSQRAAMIASIVLAALTSLNLWILLRRTIPGSHLKRLALLTLLNLLIFSPVQAENWTMGFNLGLFLINFLLTSAALVATSRLGIAAKFLLCLLLSVIASFSFGNGFILWATSFPLALALLRRPARRHSWWWLAGWCAAAVLVVGLYLIGYTKPQHHPAIAGSRALFDYYLYVTTFLGAHLAPASRADWSIFPAVTGTILLGLYCAGVWVGVRHWTNAGRRVLPWLAIGLSALISAGLAALTRVGFGVNQALDSRYTTFSLCMSIAVVGIFAVYARWLRFRSRGRPGRLWLGRVEGASFAIVLVLFTTSAAWGVRNMEYTERLRRWGKGALLFGNVVDVRPVLQTYLGDDATNVLIYANILNRYGLLHPPLFTTPKLDELPTVPARGRKAGFIDSATTSGAHAEIRGWAIIPDKQRVADCVVVAYRDAIGHLVAFAVMDEIMSRPEVAQFLRRPHLDSCGWAVHFERGVIPPGPQEISAFAVDATSGVLYQLGGSRVLP